MTDRNWPKAQMDNRLSLDINPCYKLPLAQIVGAGPQTDDRSFNPKCPKCDSPMKELRFRKGTRYWGCSQYPNCRGTRPWDPQGRLEAKHGPT